ncbi:exodeoxyribonuclease I [Methylomonas sp. HYX-M1]|uniref:exodeoxyribonuclease I n=1 Tax=Methylomonas sp. HYX-M1 TaxID=3139307 RepID=UPI00345B6375
MSANSFFWHDYETFGTDPQRDRASQFAGIRTDTDFNPIGDPVMLYCKLADDYLPHPQACLITGITPQTVNAQGCCEAEFIARIHAELVQAGTCSLGYNSIRFDDEVTRNLLYRNFFDPYAREWQNGNSRWDLIDVVRAARALRPDGVEWPLDEDGTPSFRLELLTAANGIGHAAAHDALSDVYATIALAKLIRRKQAKLYQYLYVNRSKQAALRLLNVGSFTPLVHVSGRYPAKNHCIAIVLPLCLHPKNQNEVVVYDLSVDPTALLELSSDGIKQRLFVANDELPDGVARIALKTVHVNKSPVLAPLKVVRPADAERLKIDIGLCQRHLAQIQAGFGRELQTKLQQVFVRDPADPADDPDLQIYSGGFFSQADKAAMQTIRQTPPARLAELNLQFTDTRLAQMLFRYRARNYPHTLSDAERAAWRAFRRQRLQVDGPDNAPGVYLQQLQDLAQQPGVNLEILEQLRVYATQLLAE